MCANLCAVLRKCSNFYFFAIFFRSALGGSLGDSGCIWSVGQNVDEWHGWGSRDWEQLIANVLTIEGQHSGNDWFLRPDFANEWPADPF